AIAALGMFNVTNQYTFSAIFQADMGAQGDVAARCATVTDIILRYVARYDAAKQTKRAARAPAQGGVGGHVGAPHDE
ncbi:MAG TPA: hypothetical protein VFE97_21000, partial [Methylomirabilota bacterium]|nr:hypothetical protein [Methylomirabilota bacterium]